ncbi:MAG: hypothetical protein JW934_20085 [Anaerolineae bacterium]|nr:hypothetical protein [Anaerolineae bacterium]
MSVFSTILAPLIVLGLGAVVLYISDRFLRSQDKGQAETVVLVLAIVFLLISIPHIGEAVRPSRLSDVALSADKPAWTLAFILLIGALATSLATWGRPPRGRAGRLAALGSALILILGHDRTLLVIAWVLTDVALLYLLAHDRIDIDHLTWTGLGSLLGAALFAAGAMLELSAGQASAKSIELKSAATTLLMLALAFRLMPSPLPTWQAAASASTVRTPPSLQMMAFFLPSMLAVALGQKLLAWNAFTLDGMRQTLVVIWAALILLIGALRAWGAETPARLVDNTIFYGLGMILCAVGLGLDSTIQLAAGVNAIVSVLTLRLAWSQCQHLKLADLHTWWRALPLVLALGAQIGLPLTLGFPVRIAIYAAIFQGQKWLALLLMMTSEVLFLGALLRILLDLESMPDTAPDRTASETESDRVSAPLGLTLPDAWMRRLASYPRIARRIDAARDQITYRWLPAVRSMSAQVDLAYLAGAIPALSLLVLGLFPNLLSQERTFAGLSYWLSVPRLPVWAALLLPAVGGIVAYRRQAAILDLFQNWWPLIERLFGLDWLYRALQKALGQLRGLIWGTTLVIEGAGYMAWVVLVCLVVLLFVVSR